jgi:hypothetical protein
MPSVAGALRAFSSSLQRQRATGSPQLGHMRPPPSVEYTRVLPPDWPARCCFIVDIRYASS